MHKKFIFMKVIEFYMYYVGVKGFLDRHYFSILFKEKFFRYICTVSERHICTFGTYVPFRKVHMYLSEGTYVPLVECCTVKDNL
jgi:hypothetical protein